MSILVSFSQSNVPIIGDSCDLSSPEIEVGGKKTQFYLKCLPNEGQVLAFFLFIFSALELPKDLAPGSSKLAQRTPLNLFL